MSFNSGLKEKLKLWQRIVLNRSILDDKWEKWPNVCKWPHLNGNPTKVAVLHLNQGSHLKLSESWAITQFSAIIGHFQPKVGT